MSQYQYQSHVAPLSSTPAAETITIDKWENQPPPPVRRVPMRALAVIALAMPVFVPLAKDAPQPMDRWAPRYPDKVDRRTLLKAAHLYTAQNIDPIVPIVPSASGGSVIPTGSYTLWQYQALAGPLENPAPALLALNWQPTYPDAIRQIPGIRAASQRAWTMDKFAAPTAATVPEAGWIYVQPDQARGKAPNHYRAPFFAMDNQWTAPPQNTATTLWMPKGVDRPKTLIYPRAIYTWAQPHFVIEVDVPVMSWTGIYLDPPMRGKSHQALYGARSIAPFQIADVTDPAPALSWKAYQPEQARRAINSIAAKTATQIGPILLADVADPTPASAWQGRYPDRLFGKTSISTGAQKSWTMDATFTAPVVVAAPSLAKPVYPDRVPGRPQPTSHPDMRTTEFVLDVTVPTPKLSWAPIYPDRPITVVRQPELSMTFTRVMTPPPTFRVSWISDVAVHGPRTPVTPVNE